VGLINFGGARMKRFWALVLLLFTFPFLSTLASSDEAGRIHFIDVGEGDSILLEIEGKSALIDTGNLISGPRLVKYLKEKGIEKLDYLILTHPHPDHIGGVFFILPVLKVEKIYDNGQDLGGVRKTCGDNGERWWFFLLTYR